MKTILDEIQQAVITLELPQGAVTQLCMRKSSEVIRVALDKFVASGNRRWWWEDFREKGASALFAAGDGWKQIANIIPERSELVWFIAEEDRLPEYPVFEMSPQTASEIVGQCYGFEYYLIAKDMSWLLCETHHNVIIAIGDVVEERLRQFHANT